MLQGRANVEASAAVKVPRVLSGDLVVDDDWATDGAKWCGVKVEGVVEVLPG